MEQDPDRYAVNRQAKAALPRALDDQKAGYSLDMRVYFRKHPDGHYWGGVAFLNRENGQRQEGANFPLHTEESVRGFLSFVSDLGFEAVKNKTWIEPELP